MGRIRLNGARLTRYRWPGLATAVAAGGFAVLAVGGMAQASPAAPARPAAATSALAPAAGGAAATPDTARTCGSGPGGNVSGCMNLAGYGLFVSEANGASAVVPGGATRTLYVEVVHGNSVLANSGWHTVRPGNSIIAWWTPNHNVPAGYYCAWTFRENYPGNITRILDVCVHVHS